MQEEFTRAIARQEGESSQDHYRRLVTLRGELEKTFRKVKGEAAEAEKERELIRRHARDRVKLGIPTEKKLGVEA